jgi:hypothetical protein
LFFYLFAEYILKRKVLWRQYYTPKTKRGGPKGPPEEYYI